MHRITFALLLVLCVVVSPLRAQSFIKMISNTQMRVSTAITLSDGGVLLVGEKHHASGKYSACVARLDGNGNQLWSQRRNDTTYSTFLSAAELPNGQGYVLGGWYNHDPGVGASAGLMARIDTNGNFTQMRLAGNRTKFDKVKVLPGGGFVFTGGIDNASGSKPPVWVRTDANLNPVLMRKQTVVFSEEWPGGAHVDANGNVTFASTRYNIFSGNHEFCFSKHPATGAGSSIKIYNQLPYLVGRAVERLSDGSYAYFGQSTVNGTCGMAYMHLDSGGQVLSAKEFTLVPTPAPGGATSMRLTQAQSLLFWGIDSSMSIICLADTAANIIWMRRYSLPNSSVHIDNVSEFPNGDLLVVATTNWGHMLVRTAPNGQVNCPGAATLGVPAAYTSLPIVLNAVVHGISVVNPMVDSLIHRQQLAMVPTLYDACPPVCSDSMVIFAANAIPCAGDQLGACSANGFASSFQWSFNGQAVSNAGCSFHTLNSYGNFDTLTLTSVINGCSTTMTKLIPVVSIQAGFTSSTSSLQANFNSSAAVGAASYAWQFGDSATSVLAHPQHVYAQPGTYQVCLKVTNGYCTSTFCDSITVACPAPSGGFTSAGSGFNWSFTPGPTGNYPVTYQWDLGDGTTSTAIQPSHAYAAPGTYTVCLTLTSVCGSTQFCDTVVATSAAPSVAFVGNGQLLTWNFQPTITGNGPFVYLWDFGDGTTSTQHNPLHVYSQPGTYWVCLTVTDIFGMSAQACDSVTVLCPLPSAAFTYQITGTVVDFQSQVSGTPGMTFLWDLGDGNTSSAAQVLHIYAASGTYLVCLTITDSCGTANACQSVVYNPVSTSPGLPSNWQVWPNPAHDAIQFAADFVGVMRLLDFQGRILMEVRGLQLRAQEPYRLALPALPKGIYIMQFLGIGGTMTVKLAVD